MLRNNYITSSEAAYFLQYAESTLRISRVKGMLGGKKAPSYKKVGGRIFYKKEALEDWLKSIPEQYNTGQFL